jgi:alpha-L-fucosidase
MKLIKPSLTLALGALAAGLFATQTLTAETKAENDARMGWFREARFGMFIHWGLYAVPAGEWNGKKYGGGVEWIQSLAKIPVSEYTPLIKKFNPVKYDADAWVRLAKEAGMEYIVITSKHHDGFCLWPSAQTDWDVASTPYQKDLLQPLAEACAKHGVRLCFYHSIMDWHHPEYGTKMPWRGNAATASPDMDKFTAYLKAQLDELLAYKPGILWFDGEWEAAWTHERGKDLYAYLRAKDPQLIINNRVDKGRKGMAGFNSDSKFKGDYCTPEQEIPASGLPGVDWESCMTMNNTWGYSAHDQKWKSTEVLVRNLIDITSKGGNYLLNVGPTAEGLIPDASAERLKGMGAWMKAHAEAIHGTTASPFPNTPAWGRCTTRSLPNGNTVLYLHVFEWPADRKLVVKGLANQPLRASLLAKANQGLSMSSAKGDLTITVPAAMPDKLATVIALEIKGTPQVR